MERTSVAAVAVAAAACGAAVAGLYYHRRLASGSATAPTASADPDVSTDVTEAGGGSRLQEVLNMLFYIAEDQARREGCVHRNISCDACGTSPLRGTRYKCANCIDYDVCENCEPRDHHHPAHVFVQIKRPVPPMLNPKRPLLQPFYPAGNLRLPPLGWDGIKRLQQQTHFDKLEIEALYQQFQVLADLPVAGGAISRAAFQYCLGPFGIGDSALSDSVFRFFDEDDDGHISFSDFASGVSTVSKGSLQEKITHAFMGYDMDRKGFLTRNDLRRLLMAFWEVSMEQVQDVVDNLEAEMLTKFKEDDDKPVSALFTAPIPATGVPPHRKSEAEERHMAMPHHNIARPGGTHSKPRAISDQAGKATPASPLPQDSSALAPQDREYRYSATPLLRAMSEEAVEAFIDAVMAMSTVDPGRLSQGDFERAAKTEPHLIGWLDALGGVF